MTTDSGVRPLRLGSAHRRRRLRAALSSAVTVVTAVGLLFTLSVGVANARPRSASSTPSVSVRLGEWRVSARQSHAPTIPITGGAENGFGGFNGVSCPSASECVAVGADSNLGGVASTSKDGGGTWQQGSTATGLPSLNAVDCPSVTDCVAVGQGVSVRSSDAGASWHATTVPTANTALLGVSCPSVTLCVSVGVAPGVGGPLAGQLLVSSDGGSTWKVPSLPTSVGALGSVDCPSTTFCVAVGAGIVISTDGGQTWRQRGVDGGTGVLRSVSCVSNTNCVALGPNPTVAQDSLASAFEVVTSNAGVTWTSVAMPPASATADVVSCSRVAGCRAAGAAIATDPAIVLSSGDGHSWSSQSQVAGALTAVSALSCPAANVCVFVGRHHDTPVSLKSTDGSGSGETSVTSVVRTQKGAR